MEQIFSPAPVQFGGAGRAYGAGTLPWMSGKELVGLHSMAQGPAGLGLLPAQAHFYITSGLVIVPASLSWTRHCINREQLISHPSRKMLLGGRGGG